jgi:putative oxidoreductase
MVSFMKAYREETYALMRIVTGFLFLCHGASKLFSFPVAPPSEAPAFILYTAGPIELIAGILVMIGLYTRPAAFLSSGTMAAAYWMAHGMNAPFPIENGGELAAIYCFVFLCIAARGSGMWSVDRED